MTEEVDTEAVVTMSPRDDAGQVRHRQLGEVGVEDNAEVGVESGEGIAGYLGSGPGYCGEPRL